MGYEEVETVLPADFVPRPDPVPAKQTTTSDVDDVSKSKEVVVAEQSEPESDAEDAACGGRRRSRSRSIGRKGILSRWRSKSRDRRNKSSSSKAEDSSSNAATPTKDKKKKKKSSKRGRLSFRTIKRTDSNATEKISNTSTSKLAEEKKEDVDSNKSDVIDEEREVSEINNNASDEPALPTVREGSPNTLDTVETGEDKAAFAATAFDAAAATPTNDKKTNLTSPSPAPSASEVSVEVGDENGHFEIKVESPSVEEEEGTPSAAVKTVKSTESKKSTTAADDDKGDEEASVRSTKSTKSTSSKRSLRNLIKKSKSKDKSEDVVADDENSKALVVADEAVAETPKEEAAKKESDKENTTDTQAEGGTGKWVKKVSLSIGGYKTSFQFSDPMSNLADAVNDALHVVGGTDKGLADTAKDLDHIGDKDVQVEEERDYDENPTRLFMYLQQRAWGLALTQLQKNPEEATVWVYRKSRTEKAPNVHDAESNKEAMVVQHNSLVVHDESKAPPAFRWKLLPLHAAIVLGAPTEIIQDLIRAYPAAAKKTDERGSLPVHLAASRLDVDPEGEKVVLQLFGAYPDSIECQDRKGRTPPELAKLARARKEVEEQRKINASASNASQMGVEVTASKAEKDDNTAQEGGEGEDVDDDASVKSSMSAKLSQLLRKSKSTDSVDRRRKKKKKKKKKGVTIGLTPAKSVDAGYVESEVADDASVAASLGPGFAFVKTSKSQEVRELESLSSDNEEKDEEQTDEEILLAAKKAIISKEYQTPETAPREVTSPVAIPLPMSYSMDDAKSAVTSLISQASSFTAPLEETIPEESPSPNATSTTKSVTIDEEPRVHEMNAQHQTETNEPDTPGSGGSNDSNEENDDNVVPINEGLRVLLEKAVENAGRGGMDITEFVKALEDEWVTDVEALRRLDGETLDDLLPLMLSRELQRLINHADIIDNKFLKEDRKALSRGRSKTKSKKKKKRSMARKPKKSSSYRPVTPTEGPLSPIEEDGESVTASPDSAKSDDDQTTFSIKTDYKSAKSVLTAQEVEEETAAPKLDELADEIVDELADDELQIDHSSSIEDLEIRKLHANLIADARKKFPTREALEDAIRERQADVEAAVNSGFDVDKDALARAALADDEVRKLLPLRLILPTTADLYEMIQVLQQHKEQAMRDLDMGKATSIQSEIDELTDQVEEEERYVMKKKMGQTECVGCGEMFTSEKKMKGILKVSQKHCESCRGDDSSEKQEAPVAVDSRDDQEK